MGETVLVRYVILPLVFSLLLAVVALGSGRRRAALRQRILLLGLAACIVLPVLAPRSPRIVRWSLPVEMPPGSSLVAGVEGPAADPGISRGDIEIARSLERSDTSTRSVAPSDGDSRKDGTSGVMMSPLPRRVLGGSMALAPFALAFGMMGVLLVGVRQLIAVIQLERLVRRGIASPEISREADDLRHQLGIGAAVTTVLTDEVMMPVTWGVLRPRIALPKVAASWPGHRRRVVLLHELAHVRRRDALGLWVLRAAQALYWWNPVVWWLAAVARGDAEVASDALVLDSGFEASGYAKELVAVLRSLAAGRPVSAAVPLGGEVGLHERIEALFRRPRTSGLLSLRATWVVCGGVVLCAGALGALGPRSAAFDVPTRPVPDGPVAASSPNPERPTPGAVPQAFAVNPAGHGTRLESSIQPQDGDDSGRIPPMTDTGGPAEMGRTVLSSLVAALSDPDAGVRRSAAGALRGTRNEAARTALTELLDDSDPHVRRAAEMALGRREHVAVGRGFQPTRWTYPEPDPQEVQDAIRALDTGNERERSEAANLLGNLRPRSAVPALVAALDDEAWRVRMSAANALANIGNAEAVLAVIPLLRDPSGPVRQSAASALGNLGDPAAVNALAAILDDPDEHARRAAAGALGQIGDTRAVLRLLPSLRDGNEHVRRVAAASLGDLGDPRALAPLAEATRDSDPHVRRSAVGALGDLLRTTGEE